MRRVAWMIGLMMMVSGLAFAQEPCPSEAPEIQKPADPNEKCRPDLTNDAPVLFVFPEDDKKPAEDAGRKPAEDRNPDGAKQVRASQTPADAVRKLPETCTYKAYAWDTKKKRSTDHFTVSKPYRDVTDDERDPNAPQCTICSEDQVTIDPAEFGVKADVIRICHVYAPQVRQALEAIAKSGAFDIEKLEGYRPGRTRGKIDKNGLRTEWSNHSFGAAIDINAHRNAIYSSCPDKIVGHASDVKNCKKGIGGAYMPEKQPRVSITRDSVVYREMTKFWKWGGEIEGTTKDIMHFSITGY
ncbi:MAG: M15 family metallopeptidase [Proteobacteria bacterium]|nr:M15 family metallopeptidase [Pseudomonadota bacterium]